MVNKDEIMKTFGKRFTQYMLDHNLRDIDMAKLLNMSSMNIPAYKNGARLPNPWYLVLIAEKFGCSVNELLGYDDYHIRYEFTREPATTRFSSNNRYEIYFRDRLIRLMIDENIDTSELAMLVNKTEATVRNVWLGKHPIIPSIYNFLEICDALNCTPSDLLGY